jgi:hypothetical protein
MARGFTNAECGRRSAEWLKSDAGSREKEEGRRKKEELPSSPVLF